MPLTSEGLVVDKFSEIVDSIEVSEKSLIDPNIDTTDDTLIGQLNSIFSERLAAVNELVQAVYDARALNKAEGQALDDLVRILNIVRQQAAKTSGIVEFTGTDGTILPAGLKLSNTSTKDDYELISSISIDALSCIQAKIGVATVQDGQSYDMVIDGIAVTYFSGIGATVQEIVEGLNTDIGTKTGVNFSSTEDDVDVIISSVDGSEISIILGTTFLSIDEVVVQSTVQALVVGSLVSGPNTVTKIVTSTFGLTSATNPNALTVGRNVETDEELRARAGVSGSSSGRATVDSITAALLAVQSVTSVTVEENTTLAAVNGVDPKAFRAIVVGGANADIAQTLWDYKPAGIATSGALAENATDSFGITRSVNFSRPTAIVINTIVNYTLYDEEVAPADIATTITNIVTAEIQKLDIGNDVIPKRFYGPIYAAVDGLEEITVLMGTIPTPIVETPISIEPDEISSVGTIAVNDVT